MTRFQWHEKKQEGVELHWRGRQEYLTWGVPPSNTCGVMGRMRIASGQLVVPDLAAKTAARQSLPGISLWLPPGKLRV